MEIREEGAGAGGDAVLSDLLASPDNPRRRYVCRICGVERSQRCLMVKHMGSQHPSDDRLEFAVVGKDRRRYACGVCGVVRSKLSLHRKHMLSHCIEPCEDSNTENHNPSQEARKRKRNSCEECSLTVKKPYLLRQHMYCHSDKRPFTCSIPGCDKNYKRRDTLMRHMSKHDGKMFPCSREGCKMKCSTMYSLKRHLQLHSLKGNLQRGSEKGFLSKKQLLCCAKTGCGKAFDYPSKLQSHILTVHAFQYAAILCGLPSCGVPFSTFSALKEHLRSFHKHVSCEICNASILRRSYKRHLTVHATKHPQEFQCMFQNCSHSYNQSSNLNKHYNVVHAGVRPFKCTFEGCSKTFAYKHVRDKHEKTSAHCYGQGDFYEEDKKFLSRPRGGRRPVSLEVDDLFRKRG